MIESQSDWTPYELPIRNLEYEEFERLHKELSESLRQVRNKTARENSWGNLPWEEVQARLKTLSAELTTLENLKRLWTANGVSSKKSVDDRVISLELQKSDLERIEKVYIVKCLDWLWESYWPLTGTEWVKVDPKLEFLTDLGDADALYQKLCKSRRKIYTRMVIKKSRQ